MQIWKLTITAIKDWHVKDPATFSEYNDDWKVQLPFHCRLGDGKIVAR